MLGQPDPLLDRPALFAEPQPTLIARAGSQEQDPNRSHLARQYSAAGAVSDLAGQEPAVLSWHGAARRQETGR